LCEMKMDFFVSMIINSYLLVLYHKVVLIPKNSPGQPVNRGAIVGGGNAMRKWSAMSGKVPLSKRFLSVPNGLEERAHRENPAAGSVIGVLSGVESYCFFP